jgi:hypothetical protein
MEFAMTKKIEWIFEPSPNADLISKLATQLEIQNESKGFLLLACDENNWTRDLLEPILKSFTKPIVGGIFPQIIHQSKNYKEGYILVSLPETPEIITINNLSDSTNDFDETISNQSEKWTVSRDAESTFFVFVDGLSKRISSFVEALFTNFGLEQNFIGGGAGSLSFVQKPCLITNDGLLMDAGIIIKIPIKSSIGVAHGWSPISESMKITQSDKNIIKTIDWRPAFEVYKEIIEPHSGMKFNETNFFDIAKAYPFGINKMGTEVIVRDPLMTNEKKELICVGEVPTGCFVYLLNGNNESLINAAKQARIMAERSIENGLNKVTFFIDCISRVIYMEENIIQELENASSGRPIFGALTLGEIANSGKDYLEFYNKTAVIGLLG